MHPHPLTFIKDPCLDRKSSFLPNLSPGWLSRLISKTTFITAHSGSKMRLSGSLPDQPLAAALVCGGFPGNSAGKQSAYKAGDPGSISGFGRSPGEGVGYPLQYSWASLVAQTVKNLPAMKDTWVGSLGWEDPLEGGTATHSSILTWRIPMDRGAWRAAVHGVTKS